MDCNTAENLSEIISSGLVNKSEKYTIQKVSNKLPLTDFHSMANGVNIIEAFQICDVSNEYYFLIIDWRKDENYYLVIYPKDRMGPIVEMHNVQTVNDVICISWNYKPTKRDGKNKQRRDYFKKHFLTTEVLIELPNHDDIDEFFDEIFTLVENRLKADVLSSDFPEIRMVFPEGKIYESMNKKRERNNKLIETVKKIELDKYGRLKCSICEFDFQLIYGDYGEGYIEAHHTTPVSELIENSITKIEDIILVCSNCHSILHRRRPWLSADAVKSILSK